MEALVDNIRGDNLTINGKGSYVEFSPEKFFNPYLGTEVEVGFMQMEKILKHMEELRSKFIHIQKNKNIYNLKSEFFSVSLEDNKIVIQTKIINKAESKRRIFNYIGLEIRCSESRFPENMTDGFLVTNSIVREGEMLTFEFDKPLKTTANYSIFLYTPSGDYNCSEPFNTFKI